MEKTTFIGNWKLTLKENKFSATSDYHYLNEENWNEKWDEKYVLPYKNGYNHIIYRYRNLNKIFPGKNLDVFEIGSNHPNNSKEFLQQDISDGIIVFSEDKLVLMEGSSGLVGITLKEIYEKYIQTIKQSW